VAREEAVGGERAGIARFARIDVHTHISPDGVERALQIMETWGIVGMVNLSA